MPTFKLDLIFEIKGRGFRETYYRNFPQPDFASAFTVANTLANKRIRLCGKPVTIKAYSLEDPITPGRQGSVFYFNPVIAAPTGDTDPGAASPDTTINTTWIFNANNATRTLGMRGPWDDAITNFNDLNSPAFAAWNAEFITFRSYLTQQGFGWMQRVQAASNIPVTYSVVNPILPLFTFPLGTFGASPYAQPFRLIRFSRFNGSRSDLNRELVCRVISDTTAEAAAPIAAGPMITPGRAILYGTPVFRAADTIGVTRVGRRAPGSPLLYTPGRRRARSRI